MQAAKGKASVDGFHIYEPIRDELRQVEERVVAMSQSGDPSIQEVVSYVLEGRGKMVRPAITILASKFHPCPDPSLPVIMASAVELLHLATLIHDDTVDHSQMRRGKITVSDRWGRDVALLVGDYLFATSATVVCYVEDIQLIHRFAQTIKEISHGELSESLGTYDWRQTREQYFERISKKTAFLFATAAEGGSLLSEAPEPVVKALRSYGANLGLAFQVVDDILDFQGTEQEIGKPVGSDLSHGVLTLPSILLVEQYPHDNPVAKVFQDIDRQENVDRALQMVQNGSIIEECYGVAREFCRKAHEALEGLEDSVYRQSLWALAAYVVERRS